MGLSEGKLAGQVYALKHRGEFSDLEIERFRRELGLIPVAAEVSQTAELSVVLESSPLPAQPGLSLDEHQYSEPLATLLGGDSTHDSDSTQETILHY